MKAKTLSGRKQFFESADTVFLERWKRCPIQKAKITPAIQERDGRITLTLETDRPAFFVSPDVFGIRGCFSKSMVTLLPDRPETFVFTPDSYGLEQNQSSISSSAFRRALKIYNLRDTY